MDRNKIPVRSRTEGIVSYDIKSLRVFRSWPDSGKVLYIPIDELKELMVIPGGAYILKNLVIIEDEEARIEVLGEEVEPEYTYTEDEIKYLLYEGEDNALLDCLDYAPVGVLELIRQFSLQKLPNTTVKLAAINEKLGINLSKIAEMMNSKEPENEEEEVSNKRRAAPVNLHKNDTKGKYNVVNRHS